jgi:hypothetical protein
MRAATAIVFACLLTSPALAGEAIIHGKDVKADYEPGSSVEMPFLIAPLNQDGKLVGYAYISGKIVASSLTAAVSVREKTPFLQDAFIRDVNAAPIAKSADPLVVDKLALAARLLADAKRIAGSGRAVSYIITQVQVAPTRPNRS